jgi:DNA invertase Pin-like site-specific DNA recombinase
MTSYIAYYRVSTDRQGRNDLGLEAQQQAVADYLQRTGGSLIEDYTEIESTRRNERPQLAAALKACRKQKATLIIAKLDRLARNVHFISGLMESGVDFIATDNPHANRLMIHMLAAFAEHEREQISIRTKDALAAAKRRGVILGRNGREVLAQENRQKAESFAAAMSATIEAIKAAGHHTVRVITEELNRRAIPTARPGTHWQIANTHALLKRIERQTPGILKLNSTARFKHFDLWMDL